MRSPICGFTSVMSAIQINRHRNDKTKQQIERVNQTASGYMMAAVRDYTVSKQINPTTGNTAYTTVELKPVRQFRIVALEDVTELLPGTEEYPESPSGEEYADEEKKHPDSLPEKENTGKEEEETIISAGDTEEIEELA